MKGIIIYKSKYGSSRQYAQWLKDALGMRTEDAGAISIDELKNYDPIIYVGSLYAGSVIGFGKIRKSLDALSGSKIILCMVGMTTPDAKDKYREVFEKNVPEQYRSNISYFALRGNQEFSKMSLFHRTAMRMPKRMAEKIPEDQRTDEDRYFIESFGQDILFASKENIDGVVNHIRSLEQQ